MKAKTNLEPILEPKNGVQTYIVHFSSILSCNIISDKILNYPLSKYSVLNIFSPEYWQKISDWTLSTRSTNFDKKNVSQGKVL